MSSLLGDGIRIQWRYIAVPHRCPSTAVSNVDHSTSRLIVHHSIATVAQLSSKLEECRRPLEIFARSSLLLCCGRNAGYVRHEKAHNPARLSGGDAALRTSLPQFQVLSIGASARFEAQARISLSRSLHASGVQRQYMCTLSLCEGRPRPRKNTMFAVSGDRRKTPADRPRYNRVSSDSLANNLR